MTFGYTSIRPSLAHHNPRGGPSERTFRLQPCSCHCRLSRRGPDPPVCLRAACAARDKCNHVSVSGVRRPLRPRPTPEFHRNLVPRTSWTPSRQDTHVNCRLNGDGRSTSTDRTLQLLDDMPCPARSSQKVHTTFNCHRARIHLEPCYGISPSHGKTGP
jgi:hypothetical protein